MEDDSQRILGRLEEFKDATISELVRVHESLEGIKSDIQELQQFKWRVAGGAAMLAIILTAVVEAFARYG